MSLDRFGWYIDNTHMKKVRPADVSIIFVSVIIIGLFSYFAYSSPGNNIEVSVQTSEGRWIFPLEEEGTYRFNGPLGETVVEIEDGSVRVLSSPCREQICVATGKISRPGTWIACLPNQVFIRLEGTDEEEVDAGTY